MSEIPSPPPPDEKLPEPPVPTNEPRPGAGQPLVDGPPASVGPPVSAHASFYVGVDDAQVFNLAGGSGCVALGVGALVVVIILLVVLIRVL